MERVEGRGGGSTGHTFLFKKKSSKGLNVFTEAFFTLSLLASKVSILRCICIRDGSLL